MLDVFAIICIYLLVSALKTIFAKVKEQTAIFLHNPDNKTTTLEVILNTEQVRNHAVTIFIFGVALVINFITTVINGTTVNNLVQDAAYYSHLTTWTIQLIVCFNFCRIFIYTAAVKEEEICVFLNY